MSAFPIVLFGEQLSVLVVGGGPVACRKAAQLLDSGASVHVVATQMGLEMRALPTMDLATRLTITERSYQAEDIQDANLVVAATDSRDVNAQIGRDARARGRLANVVDVPDEGNCNTVATHRAGPLTIAVSAGGVPRAAMRIRDRIARRYDERYASVLNALAHLRSQLLVAGNRQAWYDAEKELITDDFCDQVESGALLPRVMAQVTQWA